MNTRWHYFYDSRENKSYLSQGNIIPGQWDGEILNEIRKQRKQNGI